MAEYEVKLLKDVPEQFKNQANIKVLMDALAEQLDSLATFYRDLITARTIAGASGKQLDYIGDIVSLTRAEAMAISTMNSIMDDDLYRRYLLYKISLNTSSCTLQDVYDAINAFAHDVAFYSEDIQHQATIILEMSDAMYELFRNFKFAKAAGVKLDFDVFPTNNGDQYGLKSYFSYLPVEKIFINNTMVDFGVLDLEPSLYYVIDYEQEEPDVEPQDDDEPDDDNPDDEPDDDNPDDNPDDVDPDDNSENENSENEGTEEEPGNEQEPGEDDSEGNNPSDENE